MYAYVCNHLFLHNGFFSASYNCVYVLQERIARAHGSQCGFCTPGFVMSMYTLLRSNPAPSEEDVEAAFEGETCANLGNISICITIIVL